MRNREKIRERIWMIKEKIMKSRMRERVRVVSRRNSLGIVEGIGNRQLDNLNRRQNRIKCV